MKLAVNKNQITLFLIASALTVKAPCQYLIVNGYSGISASLSSITMYISTVMALLLCCMNRKRLLVFTVVTIILGSTFLHQFVVLNAGLPGRYWTHFIITSVAGLACGIVIDKVEHFIDYVGSLSAVYAVLFLSEILLGKANMYDSMVLGYTLSPLVGWLLLKWHKNRRGLKSIELMLAIGLSLFILVNTSRGCLLTVIVLLFAIKYADIRLHNKSVGKMFVWLLVIAGISIGVISILPIFLKNYSSLHGSVFQKIMSGELFDDNGRFDILGKAFQILKENWVLGVGMGVDRELAGYVFCHNVIVEIFLGFGLLLGGIFMFIYAWKVVKAIVRNMDNYSGELLLVLCCIIWVRLMVSDTYLDNMYGIMLILGLALNRLRTRDTRKM